MSRIQTSRASYQSLGNIRIGKRPDKQAPIVATMTETQQINKIVGLLQTARSTRSHSQFLYNLSEVQRLTGKIVKDRL